MKRTIFFSTASAAMLLIGCGGQTSSNSFNGYDSSLGQPPATSVTGPAAIPNAAAWPSENGKPMLIFGVGAPELTKLVISKDDISKNADVATALTEVSRLGFNVVRLTLFNNAEGLKLGKDGIVGGFSEGVEKNLATLVNLAKDKKLRIYLSFTDSFAGFEKNPLLDGKAKDAYLKNVVSPLARKFKANPNVFGFVVAGELLAVPESEKEKAVTWEQVRTFVKAASDTVKQQDPERLVSAGPYASSKLTEAQASAFGLDFFDVSIDQTLPMVKSLNLNRPVLLHSVFTKDGDTKLNALKSVEAGYAGFFYPTLGWKGNEAVGGLLDKEGKPTQLAETLGGVFKELTPVATPMTTPPTIPTGQ